MTFDAAKKVFNAVTAAIEAPAEWTRSAAVGATRNTSCAAEALDPVAQLVRIETFIGDQSASSQKYQVWFDRTDVVALTDMKAH